MAHTTSLLDLPGEIREMIFRLLLLRRDEELLCMGNNSSNLFRCDRLGNKLPPNPPILRVCRMIYHEAVSIFYGHNHFTVIKSYISLLTKHDPSHIGRFNASLIRNMQVDKTLGSFNMNKDLLYAFAKQLLSICTGLRRLEGPKLLRGPLESMDDTIRKLACDLVAGHPHLCRVAFQNVYVCYVCYLPTCTGHFFGQWHVYLAFLAKDEPVPADASITSDAFTVPS